MDKPPLGLPTGSVRAFLAITVTVTFCVLAAKGRPLPPDLVRLVEMAFGGYLLMRATQWQAPKDPPAAPPAVADPPGLASPSPATPAV